MQLKLTFCTLLILLCSICGFTQDDQSDINPPLFDQPSPECIENSPVTQCNLIPNFGFSYSGSELQAFSKGNVYAWQGINSLTPDINGILGTGQGWNIPSVPANLGPINFASMLVDNLTETTEGISTNIPKLEPGKKYALSFFLAVNSLNEYRSQGGQFAFKVVLSNCQNFSKENPGNPEIQGESQVIFCRRFSDVGDSEWQQYFMLFEAEQEFNTITIYPEVEGGSFDGGAYVHFAYPELVPIDPVATFLESEAGNGRTLLTACGVANATYLWESSSGNSYDELNVAIEGDEYSEDEYTFSMEVPDAIGNSPEECEDAEAPVINEAANKQLGTLSVDCGLPVTTSSCNLIPNPQFNTLSLPGLMPFSNGKVPFWTDCSGSSDINGMFGIAPPLPTVIAGNNYASMSAVNFPSGQKFVEGIAAKINPTVATKEYIFSFFVSVSATQLGGTTLTFNADLTNCQTFAPTAGPVTIIGSKQPIFCESKQFGIDQWRQYVVRFTATASFDMIVLYPSITPGSTPGNSYINIAYPELVEALPLTITTTNDGCGYTLTASPVCTVKNAVYTWQDQTGTVVGNGQQINVGPNAATYTCSVSVPTAEQNPNNTCSDNNPILSASTTVPQIVSQVNPCNCGGLTITRAKALTRRDSYWHDLLTTMNNSCSTSICQFTNATLWVLAFDLASNLPTGNVWKIYRDGVEVPNSGSNATFPNTYPNTNQTYTPWIHYTGFGSSPTTFEIRLTNGSFVKQIYVTINPDLEIYPTCTLNTTTNLIDVTFSDNGHSTSATTYTWSFETTSAPAGFSYFNKIPSSPNFSYSYNPSTIGDWYEAGGLISNAKYGCSPPLTALFLSENDCGGGYGYNRPNSNQLLEITSALKTRPEKSLYIYPNPTTNFFQLNSEEQIKEVLIYTIEGKLLKKIGYNKAQMVVNINEFKPGPYLITVINSEGIKFSKVVIKQ